MIDPVEITPATNPDAFTRLPGLFRRWEFAEVFEAGRDFHLEEAGLASDGALLFAVYERHNSSQEEA